MWSLSNVDRLLLSSTYRASTAYAKGDFRALGVIGPGRGGR